MYSMGTFSFLKIKLLPIRLGSSLAPIARPLLLAQRSPLLSVWHKAFQNHPCPEHTHTICIRDRDGLCV